MTPIIPPANSAELTADEAVLERLTAAHNILACELEEVREERDMLERRLRAIVGWQWDSAAEYWNACRQAIRVLDERRERKKR